MFDTTVHPRSVLRAIGLFLAAFAIPLAARIHAQTTVSFRTAEARGGELDSRIVLTLERDGAAGAFTVDVAVVGGTATPGEDFAPPPTAISFDEEQTSVDLVLVPAYDDDIEGNETVELRLSSPTRGVSLGANAVVTALIQESGVCRFSSDVFSAPEGVSAEVTVRRVGGDAGELSCQAFASASQGPNAATEGVDFEPVSEVLSFPDRSTAEQTFSVPILQDDDDEGVEPEVVALGISSPLTNVDTARLQILDDDGAASYFYFVRSESEAEEDDGVATVEVLRAGNLDGTARIEVVVAVGGDARLGADFQLAVPTILIWGQSEGGTRAFDVELIADARVEPAETVLLQLTDLSASATLPVLIDPSFHVLTIADSGSPDPEAGVLRFTSQRFTASEGGDQIEVGVVRESGSDGAVSIDLCFGDGTADVLDLELPASTRLSWGEGESGERRVAIGAFDDETIEGTEAIAVELCDPSVPVDLGEPSLATLLLFDNDFSTSAQVLLEGPAALPQDPLVVDGPAGNGIVLWVAPDGDGLGLFARLLSVDGAPVGQSFRVDAEAAGSSEQPSAVIRADGTIVVVWRQSAADDRLPPAGDRSLHTARLAGFEARVLATTLTPAGAVEGPPIVVFASESGGSRNPEVGAARDGDLVVTWEDDGSVQGRLFDAALEPRTPILDLSDPRGGEEHALAVAASGQFVVVWVVPAAPSGDGTIVARGFSDLGVARTEGESVTANPMASSPAVAVDDAGSAFVVFVEPGEDGTLDVFGRLFDRRGTWGGPKVRVNGNSAGNQSSPRVDMNSIGDVAVVWQSDPAGASGTIGAESSSIVARFLALDGSARSGDIRVAETQAGSPPASPDIAIDDEDEVIVVYERRAPSEQSEGVFARSIGPTLASAPCLENDRTLCVQGDQRFRVLVEWQDFDGRSGSGRAVALTRDTGYFWFFGPDNIELLIKVLDGCDVNDRFWVFAGGLTNVEVGVRVDDSVSGLTRSYFNALGTSFEPILDVGAFDACDATSESSIVAPAARTAEIAQVDEVETPIENRLASASSGASCGEEETALCLRDGRFQATLLWESADQDGAGQPVPLTDETGTFWFFEPDNVEAVVKVLDACDVNGHFWVFAAGITNLATDLQVLDLETSATRRYTSTLGTPFVPVLDVEAFECP
ncbi:MAG TPA: Calx-beta domain-containing protein [Thermoanaerobaculia bacterium]|nr:Calx-beta domain-containing protein [Thermoanaerobaculia bacterium]